MVEVKKVETESDKIWNEIHRLPIDVYGLPDQVVGNYLTKIELPGSELLVKMKTSAVFPALEATLSNMHLTKNRKYAVEMAKGYYLIKRVENLDEKVQSVIRDMNKQK